LAAGANKIIDPFEICAVITKNSNLVIVHNGFSRVFCRRLVIIKSCKYSIPSFLPNKTKMSPS
jgi:hypothetical protein